MTPKEKAQDFLDKYEGLLGHSLPTCGEPYMKESIQCALIAVDEIIKATGADKDENNGYWDRVKKELEQL